MCIRDRHSPSLPEGPLHQAILACIQKVAGNREDILQSLREVRDNLLAFPDTNASTFSLQQKIDQLQQEMAALVKIMAQGGDSQFYAAKLRELSEQKVKLAQMCIRDRLLLFASCRKGALAGHLATTLGGGS